MRILDCFVTYAPRNDNACVIASEAKQSLAQTCLSVCGDGKACIHTEAVGTAAYSNYVAPPDPVSVSGRGGRALCPWEWMHAIEFKSSCIDKEVEG